MMITLKFKFSSSLPESFDTFFFQQQELDIYGYVFRNEFAHERSKCSFFFKLLKKYIFLFNNIFNVGG